MLILIRGKPNSGKTAFAQMLKTSKVVDYVFAADDWFENKAMAADVSYSEVFNPDEFPEAHRLCKENVEAAIIYGDRVAVTNTFSKRWEVQPYIDLAAKHDVQLVVLTTERHSLFDSKNDHCILDEVIRKMHRRWQWVDTRGQE